jgi:hypothetical protein
MTFGKMTGASGEHTVVMYKCFDLQDRETEPEFNDEKRGYLDR